MTDELRKLAAAATVAKENGDEWVAIHPDTLLAITARVAELEAALKPFAEEAQRYEPDDGDSNMPAWSSNEFCIGHFRRAAAAMEGK